MNLKSDLDVLLLLKLIVYRNYWMSVEMSMRLWKRWEIKKEIKIYKKLKEKLELFLINTDKDGIVFDKEELILFKDLCLFYFRTKVLREGDVELDMTLDTKVRNLHASLLI